MVGPLGVSVTIRLTLQIVVTALKPPYRNHDNAVMIPDSVPELDS